MRSDAPPLLPVFRSRHQAELLMWLFLHPGDEFTMTDLAARVGVPLSTLHREVARLADAGLVVTRSIGRNRMIRAGTDHPAGESLAQLLEVSFGPRAVIAEEFGVAGAQEVIVFGSWAARYQGERGPPPRDVDVLVVGDVDRADVYDAADRAHARLGIEVNPVVRTLQQWVKPSDALVLQIKSTPHVVVARSHDLADA